MIRGASSLRNCTCSCLIFTSLLILGVGGFGFFKFRQIHSFSEGGFSQFHVNEYTEITQPPRERALLVGKLVNFDAESDHDLIIMADKATIHKRIRANVYFRGDVIEIGPEATIEGKLKVESKRLVIKGQVLGPIEGKPGQIENFQTQQFETH